MKIYFVCTEKTEQRGSYLDFGIDEKELHDRYYSYKFEPVNSEDELKHENVKIWKQLPIGKAELKFLHNKNIFYVGGIYSFDIDEYPIKTEKIDITPKWMYE